MLLIILINKYNYFSGCRPHIVMLMNGKLLYSQGLSGVRQAGSDFGGDGWEGFAVDVDDEAGGGFVDFAAARHEGFNSVAKGGGIGIFREISGRFRMEGSGSSPGGGEHGTVRGVVLQIPDEEKEAAAKYLEEHRGEIQKNAEEIVDGYIRNALTEFFDDDRVIHG